MVGHEPEGEPDEALRGHERQAGDGDEGSDREAGAERPSVVRARDGPSDVVDAGVRPGRRRRRGHHRHYGWRKAEREGGTVRERVACWSMPVVGAGCPSTLVGSGRYRTPGLLYFSVVPALEANAWRIMGCRQSLLGDHEPGRGGCLAPRTTGCCHPLGMPVRWVYTRLASTPERTDILSG